MASSTPSTTETDPTGTDPTEPTGTSTAAVGGADAAGDEHGVLEHDHPSDWVYVKVAVILAAITALEIFFYVVEDDLPRAVVVYGLLAMMAVKFIIVASYFMHLKYDNPIFKRVFYFGLLLALAVYIITLTSMEYWSEDFFRFLRS
jgi:cytochrome c oxidase subunit IV